MALLGRTVTVLKAVFPASLGANSQVPDLEGSLAPSCGGARCLPSTPHGTTLHLVFHILFAEFEPSDFSPATLCIQGKQETTCLETVPRHSASSAGNGEAENNFYQKLTFTNYKANYGAGWEMTD